MDEAGRWRHLWAQVRDWWRPPEKARPLLSRAGLSSETVDGASRAWIEARDAVGRGDAHQEHLLATLTIELASYYRRTGERSRNVAIYEGALAVLRTPRYRQFVLAALSRSACAAGDLAAAERWLASCDATSHDLATDTSYRLTRARLATARGDYPQVLSLLGEAIGQVPLYSLWATACGVLRANALERLGRRADATAQLLDLAKAGGHERCAPDPDSSRARTQFLQRRTRRKDGAIDPDRWHTIAMTRVNNGDLDLCPGSILAADAEIRRNPPRVEGHGATGCGVVVVLLVGAAFTYATIRLFPVLFGRSSLIGNSIGAAIALGALIANLVGIGVGWRWLRGWWARKHGPLAPATVDDLREYQTPSEHTDLRVEITLVVRPPAAPPVRTSIHLRIHDDDYRRCYPGACVQVRVHPSDPSVVVLADPPCAPLAVSS